MNYRKGISLGLALSLVVWSNAAALSNTEEIIKRVSDFDKDSKILLSQLNEDEPLKNLQDEDEVRIVVEMEGNPIVETATEQGIKVSELNKKEMASLEKKIDKEQNKVEKKIKNEKIKYEKIYEFNSLFNGFSAKTTLKDAKKMEDIPGVKSVTIVNQYELPKVEMNHSGETTKAFETWANGYKGEGMVVAIVDTGIDSGHKAMKLTDTSKAKYNKADVDKLVKEKGLPGEFKSDKVAYGYNYMDKNSTSKDLNIDNVNHGMHVAGIAAANGDPDNGGMKGIAPEAQLLAMKVFSNNNAISGAAGDAIVKAIDDASKLGADAMNLSLGSTASYVDNNDAEQKALNRAVENGTFVACSAGNSNVLGDGYSNPYAENPDYGVVGAPGLAGRTMQTAAVNNEKVTLPLMEIKYGDKLEKVMYKDCTSMYFNSKLSGRELEVVDCGKGSAEEFTQSVKGKVALIERGGSTFTEKASNAEKNGAVAVIIYNHAAGGEEAQGMTIEGSTIPGVSMAHSKGAKISEELKKGTKITLTTKGEVSVADSLIKGKMADFSSWGVTPDFDFKPEITAPGEDIWSTVNDDGYTSMGGTSMASPAIAGSSALVLQMLGKTTDLKGLEKNIRAKNLLMATAVPHVDGNGNYTSPRRQGAGVVNIAAATSTKALLTESNSGLCKVNLKEIKGDKATFSLDINNFGDKDITYKITGTVQSDGVEPDKDGTLYSTLTPEKVVNADGKMPISFNNTEVTVPKNGQATLDVTVNVKDIKLESGRVFEEAFKNGGYIEGFVTLEDVNDKEATLSIPYVGFKGQWDKAPIFDASLYDNNGTPFYGKTYMASLLGDKIKPIGIDREGNLNGDILDFSPNGDSIFDGIVPSFSLLRNPKEFKVEILDKEGKNVLRTLSTFNGMLKKSYNEQLAGMLDGDMLWDGTIDGKLAPEGTYTYRITGRIDFEGAKEQVCEFKVNIDNTAPTIEEIKYDENTNKLTVKAEDNNKGHVRSYALYTKDKLVSQNTTGEFNVSKNDYDSSTVSVLDYAGNETQKNLQIPSGTVENDKTVPTVKITSPKYEESLGMKETVIEGTIKDESEVTTFKINGEDVAIQYNAGDGLWHFKHPMEFKEEGKVYVECYVKDAAKNESKFSHVLFVDWTSPIIEMEELPQVTTADTITLRGVIADNLPKLKVIINGEEIYNNNPPMEYYETEKPEAGKYDLNYDYKLSNGENKIQIVVTDLTNNTTVQEFVINKVEKINTDLTKIAGIDRYETAAEVSKKGWDKSNCVVIANGQTYVDALVASPLAAAHEAPILLTERDVLPETTSKEIERLGVNTVFAVGGTNVISEEVISTLKSKGIDVIRLYGENRYETSLQVAKYIDLQKDVEKIYVAGGAAIADAVTISGKAAMDLTPIVLVEKNEISKNTLDWIKVEDINTAYITGGTSVVSEEVMKNFKEIVKNNNVERVAGANRYSTNAEVMNKFYNSYVDTVLVTESQKLVDALVAGPFAAKTGAPIMITNNQLEAEQIQIADKMISNHVVQIGGQVNQDVIKDVVSRLNIEK
ncbi:MAG: S8 family serine peptidase [Clostridium sp.]|nr:S8 family serine peptidase [Clostridium sp.]